MRWCDWEGQPRSVETPSVSVNDVAAMRAKASVKNIMFRDPRAFVAGEVHRHANMWEEILQPNPKGKEILSYIQHKVRVNEFIVPFRGDYQGQI